MTEQLFFLDTYALFEIIRGNPAYEKFENAATATTIFNLAEFNWALKKEKDKFTSDSLTKKFESILVEVTVNDIISSMDFRQTQKGLSIPDAIGYVIAKHLNAKFVTGDRAFENLENVEYIKKIT